LQRFVAGLLPGLGNTLAAETNQSGRPPERAVKLNKPGLPISTKSRRICTEARNRRARVRLHMKAWHGKDEEVVRFLKIVNKPK